MTLRSGHPSSNHTGPSGAGRKGRLDQPTRSWRPSGGVWDLEVGPRQGREVTLAVTAEHTPDKMLARSVCYGPQFGRGTLYHIGLQGNPTESTTPCKHRALCPAPVRSTDATTTATNLKNARNASTDPVITRTSSLPPAELPGPACSRTAPWGHRSGPISCQRELLLHRREPERGVDPRGPDPGRQARCHRAARLRCNRFCDGPIVAVKRG